MRSESEIISEVYPSKQAIESRPVALVAAAYAVLIAVLSVGCAPPASQGGFDSDNPASRLYAIHRAGVQRNDDAIPHLIEALDSDDPAVRVMAKQSLERITGREIEYEPYASYIDRQAQADEVERALLGSATIEQAHRSDTPSSP